MVGVRYYVALVVVVAFPPPLLAWLFVHPLAEMWRRIGLIGTYTVIFGFDALGMFLIWSASDRLLAADFGFSVPFSIIAAVMLCVSIYLRVRWRMVQRRSTILGLPEISRKNDPGDLVTHGIYARVRHPRYLEVGFWLWAAAFFSNNLAAYVVGIAYIPLIYLVAVLEERELIKRFGAAYEEYRSRVPRFIPRIKPSDPGRHIQ